MIDTETPEVGVVQIGPRYDRGDDEEFGAEMQAGAVEGMHGGDHRFAGLDQKFVTPKTEAGLRVDFRPGREKLGEILIGRCRRRRVDGALANLADHAVVRHEDAE
jgi:hypothetical protein